MWCDTAIFPKFFFLDARCVIPLLIYLFHWSWETFYVAMFGTLIFFIIYQFGYTPESSWRIIRSFAVGRTRTRADAVTFARRMKW